MSFKQFSLNQMGTLVLSEKVSQWFVEILPGVPGSPGIPISPFSPLVPTESPDSYTQTDTHTHTHTH